MGKSTHPGQPQPGGGQNVAANFGQLLTPVGDWFADLFVFAGSNAAPVHRTGRVTSRALIGGAAILAIFEIPSSGARFSALVTFNPRTNQYELALVDANSDMGLGVLVSESLNERAPVDVRVRFGKAATVIRDWTVVETQASLGGTMTDVIIAVLPEAAAEAGLTEGATDGSMHITEILVNPDRWILQFFFTGSRGEVLAAELVCSRIQPGCQPQLGCELGCAGLPGCATGCEGFQPLAGVPQGQAPIAGQALIAGQAPIAGQAQCGCAAQPIGQAQCGCQTQPIGVSQLGCAQPLALPTPVVLVPQVCAPVQTCAPLQQCARQPVPPPVRMGQHHGRPQK
jgi:hypothetical protein